MSGFAISETLRWIPLVPLLAGLMQLLLLVVIRRPVARVFVASTSCGAALISFVLCFVALFELIGSQTPLLVDPIDDWVGVGLGRASFTAELALQFDALSAVMSLLVTGIGLVCHVYSVGYMGLDSHDDGGHQRFFCLLSFFLSAMLVLVLADNLLLFFLGWEGVALCSYFFIGYWFSEPAHAAAADRAFVIERIGSFGLLVGLMLLFWSLAAAGEGALAFRELEAKVARLDDAVVALPSWLGGASVALVSVIAACFLLAACARSAQGPMLVWLPDAMAAPIPAAALVHASIGVVGGVILLCRLWFLYAPSPEINLAIVWLGAATALLTAGVAAAQTDIKKALAYITASQLGVMFVAIGCGARTAAIFHALTWAFASALLFLGTGCVIRAMNFEQDMRKMGGLRSKLVRVHWATLVGVAAVAGFPFFSGFLSRGEILLAVEQARALPGSGVLAIMGWLTLALVAFAASRMFLLIFYGQSRLPARVRGEIQDPDGWLLVPLYVLAGFTMVVGLVGLPQYWGNMLEVPESNSLANFVARSVGAAPASVAEVSAEVFPEGRLALQALAASLLGVFAAVHLYLRRPQLVPALYERFGPLHRLVNANFRLTEALDALLLRPLLYFSDRVLFRFGEQRVVQHWLADGQADWLRSALARVPHHARAGRTQAYLFTMLAGTLVLLAYVLV